MRGQKIAVIGQEDAVFGLGLLGIEGRVATTVAQARAAIRDAAADPDIALILLTEDVLEAQPASPDPAGPLVVEIPSPGSTGRSVELERRMERALGVRLES